MKELTEITRKKRSRIIPNIIYTQRDQNQNSKFMSKIQIKEEKHKKKILETENKPLMNHQVFLDSGNPSI